jgi:hypothetical protein
MSKVNSVHRCNFVCFNPRFNVAAQQNDQYIPRATFSGINQILTAVQAFSVCQLYKLSR